MNKTALECKACVYKEIELYQQPCKECVCGEPWKYVPKYFFSNKSIKKLYSCNDKLRYLFKEVIKHIDCTILEGHRGKEKQDKYYNNGKSKVKFPNSKHNSFTSDAIDVVIWHKDKPHIRWNNREEFIYFMGFVKGIASQLKIKIRCGADWDSNGVFNEKFFDGPHFELDESED